MDEGRDFYDQSNVLAEVQAWSFTETWTGLFAVIIGYLLIVLKILPYFMRNRQPYALNRILMFYNAFQVAFSLYAVFLYTRYIINYGIIARRCPKGADLKAVITEIWPYFIAKHVDLLDTVIFVLRKKDNQVTFLHVFHHSLMVTWTWFHLMYFPSDHFVVVGLINSFVHVLMYTYYGIASLGPEYSKFVWWKKHLTKVQLIQFILVLSNLHYQQKLSPCQIPPAFHYFCLSSISSFFLLFMNFYLRSYGGCDTTSAAYNMGKVKFIKILQKHPELASGTKLLMSENTPIPTPIILQKFTSDTDSDFFSQPGPSKRMKK